MDFPGGSDGKVPVYNAGDLGLIPGPGRSPGEGICMASMYINGFPGGTSGKEPACQYRRPKSHRSNPWIGKIPQRRAWQATPVLLDRGACLAGYSPYICFYAKQ